MASSSLCPQLWRVKIIQNIHCGWNPQSYWLQNTVNRRTYLTRRDPGEPGWPGREGTRFRTRWDHNPVVQGRLPASPPFSCPPFCKDTEKYRNTKHITIITLLLTYVLTPWRSRVLLEKLTGFAANQEIPRILWNPKVHYRLTSARHLSLSWANSIQSPQSHPTSWRSILILYPSHVLVSPMVSFHQVSPTKPCAHLSPPPYVPHAPPISFFSILSTAQYWVRSTDH